MDETHTLVCGPGGLTARWGLKPDIVSLGKSIAGGLPLGAYGMTDDVAAMLEQIRGPQGRPARTVATGGTLFGNALSLAAARAALESVLTDAAYDRTAALGDRLADGMGRAVQNAGLPWAIHRLMCRSGYTFAPRLPRDAVEARRTEDEALVRSLRIWLANREVWEAIPGAGPTVAVPADASHVDRYVAAFAEWVTEIVK